jgi:hypothetical protein
MRAPAALGRPRRAHNIIRGFSLDSETVEILARTSRRFKGNRSRAARFLLKYADQALAREGEREAMLAAES